MDTRAEHLMRIARELGACGAAYVPAGKIVLDSGFREACSRNGCGRYGRCHMCPPDIGEIEELMREVERFPHSVIYQSVSRLEDSFDFEGMMAAGDGHARLSREMHRAAREALKKPFLHLSSGCRLCKRCAKLDGAPCRHPDDALATLEGYGVDVYRTVMDTPLKYINGENTVTYFGMILFTE